MFFFPVKIKIARESPFLFALFCDFFYGWKFVFTPTFLKIWTGSPGFSRSVFDNFHGRHFYFHGRNAENFHGRTFFFRGRILDQCYALNPPTPLFEAVFSKSLSMNNPPFLRLIFLNKITQISYIFRAIFSETYSLGEFLKIHLIGHFFTKSPSMIEACFFFCGTAPPHPQVKDCLPVCRGGGGVPVHRWILLHLYLPIYLVIFVNKKLVIFYFL